MTPSVRRLLIPAILIGLAAFAVLQFGADPVALGSPLTFQNPRARRGASSASPRQAEDSSQRPSRPQSTGSILSPDIVAQIPRAANDMSGQAAGVVNVVIVGSEENTQLAIGTAQWQTVPASPQNDAALRATEQKLDPQAYVASALSQLFVYGRPQNYSFTHDDPNAEVQTRHCLRLWRAPFTVGGVTAWIGAVVHDVPWWDEKNANVSDKPDADVDDERDFLGDTLNSTGLVGQSGYVQRPGAAASAAASATPITIGDYHTDGRVLVLFMVNLPKQ